MSENSIKIDVQYKGKGLQVPSGSIPLLVVRFNPSNGEVIVGVESWFEEAIKKGTVECSALTSVLPELIEKVLKAMMA